MRSIAITHTRTCTQCKTANDSKNIMELYTWASSYPERPLPRPLPLLHAVPNQVQSTCLGYARLANDRYHSTTETAVDGVALLAITCIFEKFRGTLDFMNPPHPTISSAYAVDMVTHSTIQKFASAAILFPYPYFQTSSNVHNRNWYQDLHLHACFTRAIALFYDRALCAEAQQTRMAVYSQCVC